ncbi:hypothetical protein NCCP2716_18030 [Sporosarcina sp. NCCP-2716]|uniref:hypothetical protein n=1 Tax=Sporosarcina sp. NCCP-2716 TaxID=2943679 RepID=UPI00203F6C81|nr:hypothetical protein [Sporosarcina sp. NCCP-2716]GKV69305.1 hypothetical protein NCCP2716_18030 [Sporosarcina sp. NCCP-2716]
MRNAFAVLCTSLLLFCLPGAVLADDGKETEPAKERRGLVGGLLNQVKSTVDETLTSTGQLVEETVKFTGDTVDRTAKFTEDTVKTVTKPSGKRPVKEIVENTTNFVGETVESTVPVVEKTTETVQKVTEEAVKVTKPLPKVPVVTPVVDKTTATVTDLTGKVTETADETVGTVVETVTKPLKKPSAEKPTVRPDEPSAEEGAPAPSVPGKPDQPAKPDQPSTPAEPPTVKPDEKPQNGRPVKPEAPETGKPVLPESPGADEKAEEIIPAIPLEKPQKAPAADATNNAVSSVEGTETADSRTDVEQSRDYNTDAAADQVLPLAESFSMESSGQAVKAEERVVQSDEVTTAAVPLKPETSAKWKPAVEWVTGSSSVSITPSVSVSAGGGVHAIPADDWQIAVDNIRQKWYVEDIIGTLQWVHSPPGQPPQSSPFLYV